MATLVRGGNIWGGGNTSGGGVHFQRRGRIRPKVSSSLNHGLLQYYRYFAPFSNAAKQHISFASVKAARRRQGVPIQFCPSNCHTRECNGHDNSLLLSLPFSPSSIGADGVSGAMKPLVARNPPLTLSHPPAVTCQLPH